MLVTVTVTAPNDVVFVQKENKQKFHVAYLNRYSRQPIDRVACETVRGTWKTISSTQDATKLCERCARSLYGYRWQAIKEGITQ